MKEIAILLILLAFVVFCGIGLGASLDREKREQQSAIDAARAQCIKEAK